MRTFFQLQYKLMSDDTLFEATTGLGFKVRVSRKMWDLIIETKHPVMRGRELDVQETLVSPNEIRRSRRDQSVFLFYRLERPGRWICAVAKRVDDGGFLITTYPTDSIKEGKRVWGK